jgi:two-component system, LytTR family, response regulator LytT
MSPPTSASSSRLRAMIIEDEWPAREYLVELLLATGRVDIVASVATAEEAREALGPDGPEVEVAFVDINLATSGEPEAGLAIVRDFANRPDAPLFVMATALKQHAVAAFDLDAVDYLLKPFSEERVGECLVRIARRRPRPPHPSPARLVARSRKGLVFLRQNEAWAFEASERLTFVHTASGRFDVDLSLAAIEASLGDLWLRVHRNWVVNLEHVRALERDEIGTTLVLGPTGTESGGLRAPIARDKVQSVKERLLDGATGIRR